MMKFYAEAYGCTMNRGETDMLCASLADEGHKRVDDPSEADLAVIGTCVVIRKTEERMKRRIEELKETCPDVVVTGCMTTARGEAIEDVCPDAERITPDEIEMCRSSCPSLIDTIPIASGCLGNCAYCITRVARGGLNSHPPSKIAERFDSLISGPTKEVRITCQDTASYGRDIGTDLPELLDLLLEREGDHRIRIGMMNPDTAAPIQRSLIERMRDDRIYKFIHLPLQSGSDSLLRRMGRNYSLDEWKRVVELFREEFPSMTLSTDIIVGFPGETDSDFERSLETIKEIKPDILNITRFSQRPGTRAEDMDEKIHSREKKRRSKELTEVHRGISREINEGYVGDRGEVTILEEGKNGSLMGRMDNYKVVVLRDEPDHLLGERIEVEIISGERVYLLGRRL